jgi:GR25 family glycosyltransferase involved in LPS biosynthesis
MKLNEFFSKTYCINLDRRLDRWIETSSIFEKHGIICERISAKDGREIPLPPPFQFELGGSISHLNVIKKAKELNLKNVLIFEDDVDVIEDLQIEFSKKILEIPEDWDMIYFGGNHSAPLIQITENVFKMNWTYALQMYAVNSKFFDKLISFLEDKIEKSLRREISLTPSVAADYFMAQLQSEYNCYVIRPHFSWQRENYSDIQQKVLNYDYLLKK